METGTIFKVKGQNVYIGSPCVVDNGHGFSVPNYVTSVYQAGIWERPEEALKLLPLKPEALDQLPYYGIVNGLLLPIRKIASVGDVRAFFGFLHNDLNVVFHPDDDFSDIVTANSVPMFTLEEVNTLNKLMAEAWEVCEAAGTDIYDIAMESHPINRLTARKVKETEGVYKGLLKTEIYKAGQLVATFPASITQPRKGCKTIMLNGWKQVVIWE